jgi:hypothetical protein
LITQNNTPISGTRNRPTGDRPGDIGPLARSSSAGS